MCKEWQTRFFLRDDFRFQQGLLNQTSKGKKKQREYISFDIIYLDKLVHHQWSLADTDIYIHKTVDLPHRQPVDGILKGQTGRILKTCRRIHRPQSPRGKITGKNYSCHNQTLHSHRKKCRAHSNYSDIWIFIRMKSLQKMYRDCYATFHFLVFHAYDSWEEHCCVWQLCLPSCSHFLLL